MPFLKKYTPIFRMKKAPMHGIGTNLGGAVSQPSFFNYVLRHEPFEVAY